MQHDTGDIREEQAQSRDATESVKGAASRIGDEVKHEAREQAEHIQSQVESFAEEQRYEVADTVAAVAAALHAGVDSLESDGQPSMAGYWRSAASSIDQLADRVKNKPAGEVLSEAEHYVREQPGLGFGGAMVAGFMLARFLKSSSPGTTGTAGTHGTHDGTGPAYPAARQGVSATSTANPIANPIH